MTTHIHNTTHTFIQLSYSQQRQALIARSNMLVCILWAVINEWMIEITVKGTHPNDCFVLWLFPLKLISNVGICWNGVYMYINKLVVILLPWDMINESTFLWPKKKNDMKHTQKTHRTGKNEFGLKIGTQYSVC